MSEWIVRSLVVLVGGYVIFCLFCFSLLLQGAAFELLAR